MLTAEEIADLREIAQAFERIELLLKNGAKEYGELLSCCARIKNKFHKLFEEKLTYGY